jgi:hypothetical protein
MKPEEYMTAREQMAGLSIPELINLLSDDNLRTRFLAEMCLRDATST